MDEVTKTLELIGAMRKNLNALESMLRDADDLQWTPGRRKPGENPPIRQRGEVPDPTAATALDEARLATRGAVKRALRLAFDADGRIRGAVNGLLSALDAHGGHEKVWPT